MTLTRRSVWFSVYIAATIAAALPTLRTLVALARSDETASHILIVPFISLALVYRLRHDVGARAAFAWRSGVPAILTGAMLLGAAVKSGAADPALRLGVAGLVGMWLGGFLLFYGRRSFAAALFPLGFLAFMIPLPASLVSAAIEFLKNGSTEASAWLFQATGTTFYRNGFTFQFATFAIEVADQCSGIRSSLALVMTTLIAGHLVLSSAWKKALLVATIVPIAILKNAVRIVSLSLLAMYVNPDFLVGRLHQEGGIVFFLLALGLLAPVLALLSRSEAGSPPTEPSRQPLSL